MINLKEVITKYPECLESRTKLRSYLVDLYPAEKRDISIICLIFESGIAEEIKNANGEIDDITINNYLFRLENAFGISKNIARNCVLICKAALDNSSVGLEIISNILKGLGSCKDKRIIVPKDITVIDKCAFKDSDIEEIVLPEGLTEIRSQAFCGCRFLKKIIIPDSVKQIGCRGFDGESCEVFGDCINLQEVVIGKNCGMIFHNAFKNCFNLETITVKSNKCILKNAFNGCRNVKEIYYTGSLQEWLISPVITMSTEKSLYIQGELLSDLVVPESITTIPDYAFYGYKHISKVIINNNVTSIGCYAFFNCKDITSAIIGQSVEKIGFYAFSGCFNLKKAFIHYNNSEWILCEDDAYEGEEIRLMYKQNLPKDYSLPEVAANYLNEKFSDLFWSRKRKIASNARELKEQLNEIKTVDSTTNESTKKKYKLCPKCEANYISEEEALCHSCKMDLGMIAKPSVLFPKYDISEEDEEYLKELEREENEFELGDGYDAPDYGYQEDIYEEENTGFDNGEYMEENDEFDFVEDFNWYIDEDGDDEI